MTKKTIRIDLGHEPLSTLVVVCVEPFHFWWMKSPQFTYRMRWVYPPIFFHQSETRIVRGERKKPNGYLFGYALERYFMHNSSSRCECHE